MKKAITILTSIITLLSLSVNLYADSFNFSLSSSHQNNYTGNLTVNDNDHSWYVYVSSVSFSGMASGAHPVGYEIYFRPYDGNTKASNTYLTFSYKSGGFGNIGVSGDSASYKSGYGNKDSRYRLKSNSNYYTKSQTVNGSWQA